MSSIKWPTVGTSVMLNATPEKKDIEWVDAYVVKSLDNGIVVRTYWNQDVEVTDPSWLGNASNGLGGFPNHTAP